MTARTAWAPMRSIAFWKGGGCAAPQASLGKPVEKVNETATSARATMVPMPFGSVTSARAAPAPPANGAARQVEKPDHDRDRSARPDRGDEGDQPVAVDSPGLANMGPDLRIPCLYT